MILVFLVLPVLLVVLVLPALLVLPAVLVVLVRGAAGSGPGALGMVRRARGVGLMRGFLLLGGDVGGDGVEGVDVVAGLGAGDG